MQTSKGKMTVKATHNHGHAIETLMNAEDRANRRMRKDIKQTEDHAYPFAALVRENGISMNKNSVKVAVRNAH